LHEKHPHSWQMTKPEPLQVKYRPRCSEKIIQCRNGQVGEMKIENIENFGGTAYYV